MISQLQEEVVQGPIDYPRLGSTLVVRPTIEAMRAGRYPSQAVVITSAARRMIELSKDGQKLRAIVVEGENDPTKHPEFREISENLRELVNKWHPKAALCLHSDAPSLERAQSRHALNCYDQPIVRLEAGTQKTFAAITGEPPAHFRDIVENLGRLESDKLIVRATFVRGEPDNSKDNEIKAWIRHLVDIRPAHVHIETPSKATGKTKPVTKTRITQIAELVTEKTGIPVEVCG